MPETLPHGGVDADSAPVFVAHEQLDWLIGLPPASFETVEVLFFLLDARQNAHRPEWQQAIRVLYTRKKGPPLNERRPP